MYYIVESDKSFYEASTDLEAVILRLGFAILHVHDLGESLSSKGGDFDDDCKIFEVGSAQPTRRLLGRDLRLSMALPFRISVYTDNGATKIGLLRPLEMLAALSADAALAPVAAEIEEKLIQMVDEAR